MSSETDPTSEPKTEGWPYLAASALAGVIAFSKSKGMSRETFVEACGTAWDRYDEGKRKVSSLFEDLARSVGMHDDQQTTPTPEES